ncbi:MAG TPA: hypothetical protein VE913_11105, partial [Longimicrobium sp.]|nr:hypothetical protein [Longimicrobium sp.]
NGGDHSIVHVRVRGGPEGLRFRLEGPPDRRELFMWYPNAEWSRAYFEQIRHRARSDRLLITFSPTGNSREPEFIRIAFGTDVVAARRFAMRVLTRVYDASLADECRGIVLKQPLSGDELAEPAPTRRTGALRAGPRRPR